MADLALFGISSQRLTWLSARQSAVASNIANADTPNYKARDVAPFEAHLEKTALKMSATASGHFNGGGQAPVEVAVSEDAAGEGKHSGNSVSLEHELLRAGQVSGSYTLTTTIIRSFHQMLVSSVRG